MLSKNAFFSIAVILLLLSQHALIASSAKSVYITTPASKPCDHFYNGIAYLQTATKLFQNNGKIDQELIDQMIRSWTTAAIDAHVEAAYRLANLYELGMIPSSFKNTKICAKNLTKALAGYLIAAECGRSQCSQSLRYPIGIHKAALYGLVRIQKILKKMHSPKLRVRVQNNFRRLKINPQAKPQPRPVPFSSPGTPLDSEPLKKETSEHMIAQLSKNNVVAIAEEKNAISKQEQA